MAFVDNFRCGRIHQVNGSIGIIRQLVADSIEESLDTVFEVDKARFVEADPTRRDLSFGPRYRVDGDTITSLREPKVGDIVMYTSAWVGGVLRVTLWTFQTIYKLAEDKLPRCDTPGCISAPQLRQRHCAYHEPYDDDPEAPYFDADPDPTPAEVLANARRAFPGSPELA